MTDCNNPTNPPEVEAEFPAGSVPENRVSSISALCSCGMRPHIMTGLLRQYLIGHFKDPDNIEEPKLRRQITELLAWEPSDAETLEPHIGGLLIESITRWDPLKTDKRPAILIKRNAWKWNKLGIGDVVSEDVYTGRITYSGLWSGSHTLYCLAQNGAEAEFISTEVFKVLVNFAPLIRKDMGLHKFYVDELGALGEVQEVTRGYAVPVNVAYTAEEVWSLQPNAPRLKRIVFKASDLLSY